MKKDFDTNRCMIGCVLGGFVPHTDCERSIRYISNAQMKLLVESWEKELREGNDEVADLRHKVKELLTRLDVAVKGRDRSSTILTNILMERFKTNDREGM